VLACGLALVLTACGGAPGGGRIGPVLPSTQADPPAWSPPAGSRGQTGAPVGLAEPGGADEARTIALRVVRALRELDAGLLEELLGERLVGGRVPRSRAQLIDANAAAMGRAALPPEIGVEQMIDVLGIGTLTVERRYGIGAIPPALQPTDVVVTFPILEAGAALPWHGAQGTVIVRPGPPARVVGL
jgi:hypothetical protein